MLLLLALVDAKNPDKVNIVGFCDVMPTSNIKFNWYKPAEYSFKRFPHIPRFTDYRKMLDVLDKDIDAVVVATPDHMHYPIASWAIAKGKHVYCEKPLTRTIWEARELKRLAKEAGVITQMGNQGHTNEGWRVIKEWYEAGILGEIKDIYMWTNRPIWPQGGLKRPAAEKIPSSLDYNMWLGVAPHQDYSSQFVPFNWRGLRNYGTGAAGDMACHFFDVPYSAFELGCPELENDQDLLDMLELMQKNHPVTEDGKKVYAFSLFKDWENEYMSLAARIVETHGVNTETDSYFWNYKKDEPERLMENQGAYFKALELYYEANKRGLLDPGSGVQSYEEFSKKVESKQVLYLWYAFMVGYYNKLGDSDGYAYIVVPEEAEIIRKVFNDYVNGKGLLTIAKELNAMGVRTHRGNKIENRTVEYWLNNPVYIGKTRWNPDGKLSRNYTADTAIITDGPHEPIIDMETWEKAQKKMQEQKARFRKFFNSDRKGLSHWLTGILRCEKCGKVLSYQGGYFGCSERSRGKCDGVGYIKAEKIAKKLRKKQAKEEKRLAEEQRLLGL